MRFSVLARLKSFTFAFDGFAFMLRTQHNAWVHLVATIIVVMLGVALRVDADAWRWLIAAIALVWVAEAMNTAFEHLCDVVSPEFHESVKRSKDHCRRCRARLRHRGRLARRHYALAVSDMIEKLITAGPIARIARVGHAPFEGDDPIEITFADGAVFHIDIGIEAATDIRVGEGTLLEAAYGHLRSEEPATFAAIERDWTSEDMDFLWLIGATLTNPRRLAMTNPYRVDVGYLFDAGVRQFALFGEAEYIWAADLADDEIEQFQLEIGAPLG